MAPSEIKLISCRICGAIIVKISRDVCQKCHVLEEENFAKVRNYLIDHPGATIEEVVKGTKVPESQVLGFISSSRLERIGVQISHTCQTCKKTIQTGLICPECSKGLKEQVINLKHELDSSKSKGQYQPDEGGRTPKRK